ncbi:glycosyltransferase [Aestuariibius sp. 2305UL40-4]|uniref:glycosyltransferase n=1 Tax=Aestuariibius violaceus TaxID=3234132 RepID=UPI00345E4806
MTLRSDRPLRILFGSAHPYLPQMYGGAQSSTDELVRHLRMRGHEAAVLAGLTGEGWLGLRGRVALKLTRRGYVRDVQLGYPVFRAWFAEQAVARVVRDFRADVAIFQSMRPVPLAQAVAGQDLRTFIYLRNVEKGDLGGPIDALSGVRFIANSGFTARHFAETDGIDADVLYPMIDPAKYRVDARRESVVFINPHPSKGAGVALDVAELCPDIPFTFVRGWGLSPEDEEVLQTRLKRLPNVTLLPSTNDMRSVYAMARIVLAPSQWEEAFGRVAAEAQVSGIPVVASAIGGLPEAVGPGGRLVAPDAPAEDWAQAIRALHSDEQAYSAASEAARAHAARPAMDPKRQIDQLLEILQS